MVCNWIFKDWCDIHYTKRIVPERSMEIICLFLCARV